MKRNTIALSISLAVLAGVVIGNVFGQNEPQAATTAIEYVTIRWAGKDYLHVVRPGGGVEFIGQELKKVGRPERADDRAFYMNLAMNWMAKEGYEFAGMTHDEIVMERRPPGDR